MKISTIVLLFLISTGLPAEIAVIGNLNNKLNSMSKQNVQEIFMGRTRSFPNGNFALPLDQIELRSEFYSKLTGRPIEQINAYWARIMFSGQASPPMRIPDEQTIIKTVSENNGAIGYINSQNIDKKLFKVLLILN